MTKLISNTFNKIKLTDNYILFIYSYLFVMPWNFFKGQMGALTVILFIWWILKFKSKIFNMMKDIVLFKPLLLFIIFILYKYLAIMWSDDIIAAIEYTNKFNKYYFLMIPILFTSLTINEARNGLKVIIFSFGAYAIFSFFIYLGLFTIEETRSHSSNPKGILGYAIMSQYMAIGTISAFFIAIYSNNKNLKILYFIIMIMCFIGLFINNSRTAQLAFIFTAFIILIKYYRIYIFNIKTLGSIFIIILAMFYVLVESGKINRYNSVYSEVENIVTKNHYSGSFGLRIYFTKAGLEIVKDNLLFGAGPEDNVILLEQIQKNDSNYKNRIFRSFHSEHLDILTRYGFIGYILLIFSIIYLLYKLKEIKMDYLIGLSFFLITFHVSFANATFAKKPINYILVSVFVLLSVIAYNKYKQQKIDNL